MSEYEFDSIRSASMSCSIKCQYENEGLYYELDLSSYLNVFDDPNLQPLNDFYKLCLKMNPIQRQFFVEPTSDPSDTNFRHRYVYCPGNYLAKLLSYSRNVESKSLYKELEPQDKLYIMKWIFNITCATLILIANDIKPLFITDRSIFIDSKMNARYFYNYWEGGYEAKASTIQPNHFYCPPEVIGASETYIQKIEKECSYSLGILILSILNQRLPSTYFNKSKSAVDKLILSGEVFVNELPGSNLDSLVTNLIKIDPNKRPNIMEVITALINKENCLEGVDYKEFRNYVCEKFKINYDVNDSNLYKVIESNLTRINPNLNQIYSDLTKNLSDLTQIYSDLIQNNLDLTKTESELNFINSNLSQINSYLTKKSQNSTKTDLKVQYDNLKLSEITNFVKLASNTSFKEKFINQCKTIPDHLLKKMKKTSLKQYYTNNCTEQNQYDLMEGCIKRESDETYDLIRKLNLFLIENMANNLTFYIRVYQIEHYIRLIFPKYVKFSEDYHKIFGKNPLFVQIYQEIQNQTAEIDFYPYLNVYHILYNQSYKEPLKIQQKFDWLYQTSLALSNLHQNGFSMIDFSSQNVYIDLNLNAHLLPLKLIKLSSNNNTENDDFHVFVEMSTKSDFEASYYAPEMIRNNCDDFVMCEKSLVFSFGIFMLELIHGIKPGILLSGLDGSEKLNALLKSRKVPFVEKDDAKEKQLNKMIQSCLDLDLNKRKSFKEISLELEKFCSKELIVVTVSPSSQNSPNSPNLQNSPNSPNLQNSPNSPNLQNSQNSPNLQNSPNSQDSRNTCFQIDDLDMASQKGATIIDRIFDCLYNMLDEDEKIAFGLFMSAIPYNYSRFDIVWCLLNGKDIDFIDCSRLYSEINSNINIYPNPSEKVDKPKNFTYKRIVRSEVQSFNEGLVKVRNKSYLKYLHLCGLRYTSARNFLIRYGSIQNYDYRQKIEFVVKNKDHMPYGELIKMATVKEVLNDYLHLGFFKNKSSFTKLPNGDIILDLEVDAE